MYDSFGEFSVDGGWRDQFTSTVKTPGGQAVSVTANISAEKFRQAVMTMNRLGWRAAPHVNADDALDLVLDAYEAGGHIITVPPKFFPELLRHEKSVETQKQFLRDAGVAVT